jgi:thiamine-phosphate pyrophosphorylase
VKTFDLLPRPLIYLITKGEMTAANYSAKKKETLETIKIAVENKISLIQIREKQLSARLVFELVQAAAQITKNSFTKLLVNDRADIALAARADGVHLTEKSLRAEVVRHVFPKDFIIGVSAHTLETALEAKKQKADFVVYSPIFQAPQKSAPQGLKKLAEVCEKAKPFPIIALGGINEANYQSVLNIAEGFAAIRFLNDAENLRKLNREFRL